MIDRLELSEKISAYVAGKISKESLEDYTMNLIAQDDFDANDEQTQDIVYTVDNADLNELRDEDLIEIAERLKTL